MDVACFNPFHLSSSSSSSSSPIFTLGSLQCCLNENSSGALTQEKRILATRGYFPYQNKAVSVGLNICLTNGRKHLCKKLHQCVYIGVERVRILFKNLSGGTEENFENLGAHCPSASI